MRIKDFITYKKPYEALGGIVYRTHFISSDDHHFVISEKISPEFRDAQIFRCNEYGTISDYESPIAACKDTEQCIREFSCWNAFIS